MNHNFSDNFRGLLDGGKPIEAALSELRAVGASKVDSIITVKAACGYDLAKAKHTVHLSETWADAKDRHDEFHESMESALNADERD